MIESHGISSFATIALTAVAMVVAFYDLRERRIPNFIVLPTIIIGLGINAWRGEGLLFGLKGLAVGFALLFIPYLLKAMGAGDVKFLAAIGAFVGAESVIRVLLLALLTYPLLAIIIMIKQRKVALTLKRFVRLTCQLFGVFIPPLKLYATQLAARDNADEASAQAPFGVTISIGTLLALYTRLLQ